MQTSTNTIPNMLDGAGIAIGAGLAWMGAIHPSSASFMLGFLSAGLILFCVTRIISRVTAGKPGLDGSALMHSAAGILMPELAPSLQTEHIRSNALHLENGMLIERYQILTDNLAAAVVMRDAEGKITYCSPFTEVLTGYSVDEIYASTSDFFETIIHEDDKDIYARALKVTACGESFQFRYRFVHKTGLHMWGETRTVPILDERGEVRSSLSVTLDVTGSVRHQRLIEEKNRDLQDFTYMVSHDLKSPIFTIKGMVSVLNEDFASKIDDAVGEPIEHIQQAAERLEMLVGSVLEYSRISTEDGSREEVDLGTVLEEIRKEFTPRILQNGASLSISSHLPIVRGNKLRLYQVFSNLLDNAIKYREKNRPLEIVVEPAADPAYQHCSIRVRDNGSGIPDEKRELIFRPFHRAHDSKQIEGSGIGLACAKKIVEKLGGEIKVESVEGCSTEFIVTLERAHE